MSYLIDSITGRLKPDERFVVSQVENIWLAAIVHGKKQAVKIARSGLTPSQAMEELHQAIVETSGADND